jgi:methionyl-tRNA formyltransferase
MKTVVLYTRRNVGLVALSLLVAKGYKVKVISDDDHVLWMAEEFGCKIAEDFDTMGEFDIFLSVHGWRIVPMKYLKEKIAINVHPCLSKYKGKNPIERYISNEDVVGSVESHIMEAKPDEGKVIHSDYFPTGVCRTYQDFYNFAMPFYFHCILMTFNKLGL